MKKIIYSVIIASLIIGVVGCGSIGGWLFPSPSQKAEKAAIKVEQTKQAIEKKDDAILEVSKSYVWAANYSLALDPTPSIYTKVGKGFTERAITTLGSPEMAEIIQLREIVNNLVSTNKALVLKGEEQLADKDLEVVKLQSQIKKLEDTLQVKEDKLKQVNEENSKLATTWKKITSSFWWIVWIIGILFVINVISHALPPPWNSVAYIIGLPVSLFIKTITGLVPSAKKFAGTVAETTYKESQDTLEKLVLAIEDIKKKQPDVFEKIEPSLKDKTTPESRAKILEIKKDYSLI